MKSGRNAELWWEILNYGQSDHVFIKCMTYSVKTQTRRVCA
jgi:hypothetical protein